MAAKKSQPDLTLVQRIESLVIENVDHAYGSIYQQNGIVVLEDAHCDRIDFNDQYPDHFKNSIAQHNPKKTKLFMGLSSPFYNLGAAIASDCDKILLLGCKPQQVNCHQKIIDMIANNENVTAFKQEFQNSAQHIIPPGYDDYYCFESIHLEGASINFDMPANTESISAFIKNEKKQPDSILRAKSYNKLHKIATAGNVATCRFDITDASHAYQLIQLVGKPDILFLNDLESIFRARENYIADETPDDTRSDAQVASDAHQKFIETVSILVDQKQTVIGEQIFDRHSNETRIFAGKYTHFQKRHKL